MPRKYRCLLIGLGQIGMGYDFKLDPTEFILSHAQAFYNHIDFELVGAVDRDSSRLQSFRSKFDRPAYAEISEALQYQSPDIVIIATPSDSHGSVLDEVFKHIIPKVIVCEKPIDNSLDVAKRMVKICEDNNVLLFVNYIRRSDPGVIKVKEMLESEVIRAPLKAFVWYSKGLINNGSHMFNLLEYWLGRLVAVKMISDNRIWDYSDPEPDFKVEFEKGSAIFCASWEEHFSHYGIELLSSSGRLAYDRGGNSITWQERTSLGLNKSGQLLSDVTETIPNNLNRYQSVFADNLALALKGKNHHLCTGEEALQTLTNIFKIIDEDCI